ncbi:hypothetical protein AB0M36_24115 [Actinoplanes sp. NPDC051346]|uniref:hypothetical protein n=1 Tax=Actinoplanes sp. NPDC051346 TaxID=3155048 RepID=UPI00343724C0
MLTHRWRFLGWYAAGLLAWVVLPSAAGVVWTTFLWIAAGCAAVGAGAFLGGRSLWRTAGPVSGALMLMLSATATGYLAYADRDQVVVSSASVDTVCRVWVDVWSPTKPVAVPHRFGCPHRYDAEEYGRNEAAMRALSTRCARAGVATGEGRVGPGCFDHYGHSFVGVEVPVVAGQRVVTLNPRAMTVWAALVGTVAALAGSAGAGAVSALRRRRRGAARTAWTRDSLPPISARSRFAVDGAGVALVPAATSRWRRWARLGGHGWIAAVGLGWMLTFVESAQPRNAVAGSLWLAGLLVGLGASGTMVAIRATGSRYGRRRATVLAMTLFGELLIAERLWEQPPPLVASLLIGVLAGALTESVWLLMRATAPFAGTVWGLTTDVSRASSAAGRWATGISCLAVAIVGSGTAHRAGFRDVWLADLDEVTRGGAKLTMAAGHLAGAVRIRSSAWRDAARDVVASLVRGNRAVGVAAVLSSTGMAIQQITTTGALGARVVGASLAAGVLVASLTRLAQLRLRRGAKARP